MTTRTSRSSNDSLSEWKWPGDAVDSTLTCARYIHLQEEYIKDEQRSLKRELVRAQEEIKRIQSVPLVIGQFMEAIDQK
jgi:ATP-dependent 26S proteasome regulatory subunit